MCVDPFAAGAEHADAVPHRQFIHIALVQVEEDEGEGVIAERHCMTWIEEELKLDRRVGGRREEARVTERGAVGKMVNGEDALGDVLGHFRSLLLFSKVVKNGADLRKNCTQVLHTTR